MTVNISKPSINVREKLSELDKPSGIAGEAVLRADSVQEIRNQIGAGRKNLIINGGMQVSQRGTYTSATTASDNSYYIDRWKDWSGIARTIQNTTVTLNNISNTKAVKYTATATSASSYMGTRQMVEGDFFPNGAVVTASCYMRTNNANARIRTYGVVSGGVTSSACPSDGAWHKVSLTQTSSIVGIPEVGVLVYDADETPTAIATGDYIEFTHFQLELGSVSTDFEHRSYGEELALCQRYFETNSSTTSWFYSIEKLGAGYGRTHIPFMTVKHHTPTIT